MYTDVSYWHLFEDAAVALDVLSEFGWRHAILSNHVPELGEIVQSLGVRSRFDAVYTSALTGYEKAELGSQKDEGVCKPPQREGGAT